MNKLLVWDIDGTLVEKRHGADSEFAAAVRQALGLSEAEAPKQIDGDTDFMIITRMLSEHGIPAPDIPGLIPGVLRELDQISCDHDYIRARRDALPGARSVLQEARSFGLLQTYGTGNSPNRGRAKAEALGLGQFLDDSIGGFGDWTPVRAELIGRVRELAALAYGHQYPGKQMIVIGDTPKDIEAAQTVGARSVAVATGKFTAADLECFSPDLILQDLSDDPLPRILEG